MGSLGWASIVGQPARAAPIRSRSGNALDRQRIASSPSPRRCLDSGADRPTRRARMLALLRSRQSPRLERRELARVLVRLGWPTSADRSRRCTRDDRRELASMAAREQLRRLNPASPTSNPAERRPDLERVDSQPSGRAVQRTPSRASGPGTHAPAKVSRGKGLPWFESPLATRDPSTRSTSRATNPPPSVRSARPRTEPAELARNPGQRDRAQHEHASAAERRQHEPALEHRDTPARDASEPARASGFAPTPRV